VTFPLLASVMMLAPACGDDDEGDEDGQSTSDGSDTTGTSSEYHR
jgi:hypothetical protein